MEAAIWHMEHDDDPIFPPKLQTSIQNRLQKIKTEHDVQLGLFLKDFDPTARVEYYLEVGNDRFFVETINNRSAAEMRSKERRMFDNQVQPMPGNGQDMNLRDFYRLCRGESLPRFGENEHHRSQRCHLTTKRDPFLMIQPLKTEILMQTPMLIMFHDVIRDGDIELLKASALPKIERAKVYNGQIDEHSIYRISSLAWFWERDNPRFKKISENVEIFSGLLSHGEAEDYVLRNSKSVPQVEALQVGVYIPGGHFLPHIDPLFTNERFEDIRKFSTSRGYAGDRLATFMFYLSEVGGGATVFPLLGRAVFPRKGSALMWLNLKRDGRIEQLAEHGACPTYFGIKWVCNKWIREGPQVFRLPCSLEKQRISHVNNVLKEQS